MNSQPQTLDIAAPGKRQEVYQAAEELYRRKLDWITFFRDVLGLEGIVQRAFPSPAARFDFEQSTEFLAIQGMLAELRQCTLPSQEDNEPTRVITVRLPKSMHESLRAEAHARHTSMNKLCISKLLQYVEENLVPTDAKAQDEISATKPSTQYQTAEVA